MWYLYLTIGLAAVCIGIPVFLVYWTDKRKRRSFEKRNKKSDDMKDLDHYRGWQIILKGTKHHILPWDYLENPKRRRW